MSNLRDTIDSLATQFASSIMDALRSASLDELMALGHGGGAARRGRGRAEVAEVITRKKGKGGRLGRRTADDIARMIDAIVELLQKNPEGMRAEQIRESLGCEAKELPRPLAEALEQGRISKSGQKRATTYFSGGGEGGAAPKRRAGRRAGGRKKRG